MYDDANYANSRITDTVIRDNENKLLYVNDVFTEGFDIKVRCTRLIDKKDGIIKLSQCNLKPLPLGNVQHKRIASYLTRIPLRQDWRQGNRKQNTISSDNGIRIDDWFNIAKGLQDCVDGVYTNFEKAFEKCKDYNSIAFSRKFKLAYMYDDLCLIYYKSQSIGEVNLKTGDVNIQPTYNYLREQLEGAINA